MITLHLWCCNDDVLQGSFILNSSWSGGKWTSATPLHISYTRPCQLPTKCTTLSPFCLVEFFATLTDFHASVRASTSLLQSLACPVPSHLALRWFLQCRNGFSDSKLCWNQSGCLRCSWPSFLASAINAVWGPTHFSSIGLSSSHDSLILVPTASQKHPLAVITGISPLSQTGCVELLCLPHLL